jgi:hypothetical protein
MPGFSVSQPAANVNYMSGTNMNITFTALGPPPGTYVQFQLLARSTLSILLTFGTVLASSGFAVWSIPSVVPTGQYYLVCTPPGIYSPIYASAPPSISTLGDNSFTITQSTCTSHSSCGTGAEKYCALRGSTGICTPCSFCLQFRDPIDGRCPNECGGFGLPFGTTYPNLPEADVSGAVTLGICGTASNMVVLNTTTNIVFANATASSNPRMMTSRLSQLLINLAARVQTSLSGSMLYVISAADTRGPTARGNVTLAVEGRAAVLSLSPTPTQDQLSVLAGLAVLAGLDWVDFRTAGSVYVSVSAARCLADIDLIFLLDVSGSIQMPFYGGNSTTFSSQVLGFVRQVVNNYDIGPNNTRVAIASFSTNSSVNFLFNAHLTKTSLLSAIGNIPYTGGSTRTSLGLQTVRRQILPHARPSSQGFSRVIITITDGNANYGFEGGTEASLIQSMNVNMFAVGVGIAIDYPQIVSIASPPSYTRVFQLQSFNFIYDLVTKMSAYSCAGDTYFSITNFQLQFL